MARSYRGSDRGNKLTVAKGLKGGSYGPAGPAISLITGKVLSPAQRLVTSWPEPNAYDPTPRDGGIWIVRGADRSPTGERQIFHFKTLKEAHAVGFTWAL